jgi:sugar/nucleoside kinase (ribokinase family)
MKFLALDSPVLDIVLMKRGALEVALKDVQGKSTILDLYDNILKILNVRKDRPGDKNNLEITEEIESLNDALHKFQQKLPIDIHLLYLGGSACRKLHHTMASLCDSEGGLIGATKDDAEGDFLRTQLKKSNIELYDNGMHLESIRKSLIYTPEGETDRVILRFPFKVPSQLYGNFDFCREKIEESDAVLLETSRINMFGENTFSKILQIIIELDKKIVFYPPTFAGLLADDTNKKLILKTAQYSSVMTMNAEEGISTFLDHKYRGKVKNLDDVKLQELLNKFQIEVREKQLAIVTVGMLGAFGITKNHVVHVNAKKIDKPINTLGAGDSFSGGVVARYFSKYADKELSNLEIKDILEYGVDLASVVIQQPGGLLDPKLVACMR